MLALIDYIKTALAQTTSLEEGLSFLPVSFQKDFPIAYIHSQTRMPDSKTIDAFSQILDEDGHTPSTPTKEQLDFIQKHYPKLIQSVSYMCLTKANKNKIHYTNKHKNDFWKKIQDIDNIQAVFDVSKIANQQVCEAEFTLREVIRKRKEVHALKGLGFIWLAESSEDISTVFEHYFKNRHLCINGKYYLGWAKSLKEINMRYFVCQPE